MTINSLELSKQLIACDSVTPKDGGSLDILQKALESMGFKCERMVFSEKGTEDVDNLYARLGDKAPNLCFAGHTDVVPPGPLEKWTSNPFKPEVRAGVLYGRGAVDMKGAIACFVAAVSEYLKDNKPKGSISLLITGDEEAVSINGTKKMLEKLASRGEKIDVCIVGEPTNAEKLGDTVKIGRRGSVTFNLKVTGKQGHVAYPHLSLNPVSPMLSILHELDTNELDEGTKFFQPSNLEIVSVDVGNTADNVIPEMVSAKINIRFNDQHTGKSLVTWVEGICKAVCEDTGAKYELKSHISGESFITQPGEFSDIVASAVKEATGVTPELSTTGGTSDARFIKNYCPVVEFGLINKTAHKIDECVPVSDLDGLTKVYKLLISKYFG